MAPLYSACVSEKSMQPLESLTTNSTSYNVKGVIILTTPSLSTLFTITIYFTQRGRRRCRGR